MFKFIGDKYACWYSEVPCFNGNDSFMKWKWLVKIWMMLISLYIIFIEFSVYSNSLIQEKRRTLTWFISYNYSNQTEFIFNKIFTVNCQGWREESWPVFYKMSGFLLMRICCFTSDIIYLRIFSVYFPAGFYKLKFI